MTDYHYYKQKPPTFDLGRPFFQLYVCLSDPRLLDTDDFFVSISFSILAMQLNPVSPGSQFNRQLRGHGLGPAWIWRLFTFGGFAGWEQCRHASDK
jgi:hypothetical protein